jgi:hypothetical protein
VLVLETRSQSPQVLECSCEIIIQLRIASLGASAWKRLSQTTTTSAVVSAMRACSTDAKALDWGCQAIIRICGCVDDAAASEIKVLTLLRQHVFDAGAVEVVVAAMRAFPSDDKLMGSCCSCLSVITHVAPTTMDKAPGLARLRRVGGVGAIELSVTALQTHPTSDRVLRVASSLLTNLSYFALDAGDAARETAQQHTARAARAGAVQAIVAAMQARPASMLAGEAVGSGVRALRNIMLVDAAHKPLVANLGAVEVVLAAMEAHRQKALVQTVGLRFLHSICSGADCDATTKRCKRAMDANALATVVAAKKAHPQDGVLQTAAGRAETLLKRAHADAVALALRTLLSVHQRRGR